MNTACTASSSFASAPLAEASVWEQAYLRFETPTQEIRKFQRRLIRLGARAWEKDSEIVELFCGRGNGLRALHWLGFDKVEGVDLSPYLANCYRGPGKISVGDCRDLPLSDSSRDILIVQGGLHHLPSLPDDLDRTLSEAARVLRPGGRFIAVEPWLTPFLQCVHLIAERSLARSVSRKIDALAVMIENERTTYEQWLNAPQLVLQSLHHHFDVQTQITAWGKLSFVGRKR